jgi:hypothetical protein
MWDAPCLSPSPLALVMVDFFFFFWKPNNRLDQQVVGSHKSSSIVEGKQGFHMHISGFELVLGDFKFFKRIVKFGF